MRLYCVTNGKRMRMFANFFLDNTSRNFLDFLLDFAKKFQIIIYKINYKLESKLYKNILKYFDNSTLFQENHSLFSLDSQKMIKLLLLYFDKRFNKILKVFIFTLLIY